MSNTKKIIEKSTRLVSEYWPLQSFIAVNPLWDSTEHEFFSMVKKFADFDIQYQKKLEHGSGILFSAQVGDYNFQPAIEYVKQQCIATLTELFSEAAEIPAKQQGEISAYEKWLNQLKATDAQKHELRKAELSDVVDCLATELNINKDVYQDYFEAIFQTLYGYASLSKWMEQHPKNPWLSFDFSLTHILIIWLWQELKLANELNMAHKIELAKPASKSIDSLMEQQKHAEESYQKKLLAKLIRSKPQHMPAADVQAIFCIDTRSELLRRHLEKNANIQTFGYAGFFGFGFILDIPTQHQTLQCPALLTPDVIVKVKLQQKNIVSLKNSFTAAVTKTKKGVFASLNLFELLGLWQLFGYIGKTFMPTWWHAITSHFKAKTITPQNIMLNNINIEDASHAAWQMLTTIGLTDGFAKTVVVCGHQSVSENNPYASSLDCGACGGNSGMVNAMIAVKMLNNVKVREQLKGKGIDIPSSTKFIAACHYTTYDNVDLYDEYNNVPLRKLFEKACNAVRDEKLKRFPMLTQAKQRQFNWAELVPEYGLVNNASMVIGPRWLTEQSSLAGRVFLHSYQPKLDPAGDILESIMLAPMVVAHWINMQYYFSTLLPRHFSAGNKALHNVIPGIGVMEGNTSDLKIGLPEQSLRYRGKVLHSTIRLTVVIYASHDRIKQIVNKHEKLSELVAQQWLFVYGLVDDDFAKVSL